MKPPKPASKDARLKESPAQRTPIPGDQTRRTSPASKTPRQFGEVLVYSLAASLFATMLAGVGIFVVRGKHNLFDDIIASDVASYYKNADLLVAVVWFLFTLGLVWMSMTLQIARRAANSVARALKDAGSDRGFALYALCVAVAMRVAFDSVTTTPVTISLVVAVLPLILYRPRPGWASRGDLAMACVVGVAATLATLTTLSALSRGFIGGLVTGSAGQATLAVSVFGTAVTCRLLARRPQHLGKFMAISQPIVPMLLLGAGLSFVSWQGSTVTAPTKAWLVAVVGTLVGLLIASAVLQTWKTWDAKSPVTERLLATTVISISGFLALRLVPPSAPFLGDDFHVGESLIQWSALSQHASSAFQSFVPIPGLHGFLYGAVNATLGGTAQSFSRAVFLTWVVLAIVSAVLLCRLVGPVRALLLVPQATVLGSSGPFAHGRFVFLIPSALVLLLPQLRSRPVLWTSVWAALVTANVILISATGTAFLLATLPVAVFQIGAAIRSLLRDRSSSFRAPRAWTLGAVVGLTAGVVVAFPLFVRALRFVVEQAGSNSLAWGLPLLPHVDGVVPLLRLLSQDVVRFSGWWLGIPVVIAIVVLTVAEPRSETRSGLPAAIALTTGLFVVAITPYAFGRIDGSGMSRPGEVTVLALSVLLPLALFTRSGGRKLERPELRLLTLLLLLAPVLLGWAHANLAERAGLAYPVSNRANTIGGGSGLPGLESSIVPADPRPTPGGQTIDLTTVGATLERLLDDDETFLDMTNHQALYEYTGRAIPIAFGAVIYAAAEPEQNLLVSQLEAAPVPVALLSSRSAYPSVLAAPSLRAYRVARWLFESGYLPFRDEAEDIYFVSPPKRARALGAGLLPVSLSSLDQLLVGDSGLGDLPGSWGRSFETMAWRFEKIPLTGESGTPDTRRRLELHLPGWEGQRPDFVLVHHECSVAATRLLKITWTDSLGIDYSTTFPAEGQALVPLGSFPSWTMSKSLKALAVEVQPTPCSGGTISIGGFYRLVH